MRHLDDGSLQEWLDRERSGMDATRAGDVERHLGECAACSARVAELDTLTSATKALLSAPGEEPVGRRDYDDVRARARRRRHRPRIRRPVALGWAATVMLALGAGWLTNELVRGDRVPASRARPTPAVVQPDGPGTRPARVLPSATPGAGERATEAPSTTLEGADPVTRPTAGAVVDASASDGAPERALSRAGTTLVPDPTPAAPPTTVERTGVQPPAEATPVMAIDTPTRPADATIAARYLTGRVTDEEGNPLAAAQVYLPGSAVGALTGSDGTYRLALGDLGLDSTAVLRVDLIGFSSGAQRLDPSGGETISTDFTLSQQALALDAIVVTGTASPSERRAVGNSVATVAVAEGAAARPALEVAGWQRSNRSDAETRAGFSLLLIPDAPVTSVHVRPSDERWVVRVVQHLASGVEVVLTQARGAPVFDAALGIDGWAVATVLHAELTVTGTAPLPLDSLHALLERAR